MTALRLWVLALALLAACEPDVCSSPVECSGDQVCEGGHCLPSAAQGEPCRSDQSCNEDNSHGTLNGVPRELVCSTSTHRCVLESELDAPCERATDCDHRLICERGSCIEPLPDGVGCNRDEQCWSGFCHPLTGACGKSGRGGLCETYEHCSSELLECIRGACMDPQAAGAPCGDGSECKSGYCINEHCMGGAGELCSSRGVTCLSALSCAEARDGERRCIHTERAVCAVVETNGSCDSRSCWEACAACQNVYPGEDSYYVAAVCVPR